MKTHLRFAKIIGFQKLLYITATAFHRFFATHATLLRFGKGNRFYLASTIVNIKG